ncbi:hypothetical protein LINPERHAP1_LOCUS15746, partial [Linum perenne]
MGCGSVKVRSWNCFSLISFFPFFSPFFFSLVAPKAPFYKKFHTLPLLSM